MLETLEGLEAGAIQPIPQDDAGASLAPILEREDALVDFARSAGEIYNRWRGFQPWPGAYTFFRGKKLTLHRLHAGRIHRRPSRGIGGGRGSAFRGRGIGHAPRAAGGSTGREEENAGRGFSARHRSSTRTRGWASSLPSPISPARKAAFELLLELRRKPESHSDVLLRSKRVEALSALDKNLATTLVMGVLRWQLVLQQRIGEALTKSRSHLADPVQVSLELGALQLLLLDRIPAHAAIFESVELVRQSGSSYAVGLVNAVLRKLAQAPKLEAADASAAHPSWLVERWVSSLWGWRPLPRSAATTSFLLQPRSGSPRRRRKRKVCSWKRASL